MLVEQNTLMVEEREREIRQIVQSISDLNEIFRDLGAMIVEQVRAGLLTRGLSCRDIQSFSASCSRAPARPSAVLNLLPRVCVCVCVCVGVCVC